jgi:hypothetical protein
MSAKSFSMSLRSTEASGTQYLSNYHQRSFCNIQ